MNQNNQFNNYDPNTGQPLNNINQPTQSFDRYDPVTGQPLNTVNNQMQVNNNVQNTQMNNMQNSQVNNVSESAADYVYNQEVTKAYNTLKNDFLAIAVLHLLATVMGVFLLEYNSLVVVLRFGILSIFIFGFISAKNKRSSAVTFAIVSAVFLFLARSIIDIGLGIFMLIHANKCSKVVKRN